MTVAALAPHTHLIAEPQLLEWLGYERRADLERWLQARGVPYDHGRGGRIVTTTEAVNQGLIGADAEPVEFD